MKQTNKKRNDKTRKAALQKEKKNVYFGFLYTKGSAAKLTQTNKFAFDKTTATTFAFSTKPSLFPASLSS